MAIDSSALAFGRRPPAEGKLIAATCQASVLPLQVLAEVFASMTVFVLSSCPYEPVGKEEPLRVSLRECSPAGSVSPQMVTPPLVSLAVPPSHQELTCRAPNMVNSQTFAFDSKEMPS